ncbi:MAG: hypothetical protein ACQET7_12360 [Thermodesulfobacteriota bacterium]
MLIESIVRKTLGLNRHCVKFFQLADDFFAGGRLQIDTLFILENLICGIRFLGFLKQIIQGVFRDLFIKNVNLIKQETLFGFLIDMANRDDKITNIN